MDTIARVANRPGQYGPIKSRSMIDVSGKAFNATDATAAIRKYTKNGKDCPLCKSPVHRI